MGSQFKMNAAKQKRLYIRLSSLGDIILASSVLEDQQGEPISDWVVSKEYAEVLSSHPRINRLWVYDKKSGLAGWIRLSREIWESRYESVFDLHLSLRSRVMKVLFLFWFWKTRQPMPQWRSVAKSRGHLYMYFLFKGWLPIWLRPRHWLERFSVIVGQNEKRLIPNFGFLVQSSQSIDFFDPLLRQDYLCVMPSSKWSGKEWPVENYVQVFKKIKVLPVILGRKSDSKSVALVDALRKAKLEYVSGVGKWSLQDTATILSKAKGFIGVDTGLAHLAQSLGVRTWVLFGPTTPDLGFGPWGFKSHAIDADVKCRPCGKDGRFCYRLTDRFRCMQSISPLTVASSLKDELDLKGDLS